MRSAAADHVYVRHSERIRLFNEFRERHAPAFESGLWKVTSPIDDEGRIFLEFSPNCGNRLSAGAVVIPATETMKQSVLFLDQYGDDNGFRADLTPDELTAALLEQAGMRSLEQRNEKKENMDAWAFWGTLLLGLWIAAGYL